MNEKHKLLELVKAIKKEPSNDKKWEILIKWLDIFMTKLQGSKRGNNKTSSKGISFEILKDFSLKLSQIFCENKIHAGQWQI